MRILLISILAMCLFACSEPCKETCKFKVGQDVHIKHKARHNTAVITEVGCQCEAYIINYYSDMGVRRHRKVTEGEITAIGPDSQFKKEKTLERLLEKAEDKIFKQDVE